MFRRRTRASFSLKIRRLIWPQMGFKRLLRYYTLRIVRLSSAPEPLARAIACGVSVAVFPVFGIHALLGMGLACLVRANIVAAGLASLVVPPVLFPLLLSLDFLVGRKILRYAGFYGQGTEGAFIQKATQGTDYVLDEFATYFLPAMVGSAVFMLLLWPSVYMAAHKMIALLAHRHRNRKRHKTGTA